MFGALRRIAALLVGMLFLQGSHAFLSTTLSLNMELRGLDSALIGLVSASFHLGFVLSIFLAGPIIERVGRVHGFAIFAATLAVSALSLAWDSSAWFWVLARAVAGVGLFGAFAITESWLNDSANPENRGRLLSIYMILMYFAQISGQALVGFIDLMTPLPFALAGMLCAVSLIPVSLSLASMSNPTERPDQGGIDIVLYGIRRLYSISPLGVIGCFFAGVTAGSVYGLGPVFLQDFGLNHVSTAGVMSAYAAGGLLAQWPVGKLSDLIDRRSVLIGVAMLAACICALIIFLARAHVETSFHLIFIGFLLAGCLFSTAYPLTVSHSNDFIEPHERVRTSSGLLVIFGIGAFVAPTPIGLLMDSFGGEALFWCLALSFGGIALFGLYRIKQRASLPNDEQNPFIAFPQNSALAAELDPLALPQSSQISFDFDADGLEDGPW